MKFKFTFVLLVLIGQFFSLTAREVTSFNEGWLFKRGPFSEDPLKVVAQWEGKWETVNLPHTWNAKDMQVKAASFYEGVGYYKKKQFFNEELKGKRVFLRFEGVGANTEVYVNSKLVGTHKGGYSAFAFEIGTALKFGAENEIMVKADNTARPDVIPVNHSLFGVYGGIYRPVCLIITQMEKIDLEIKPNERVFPVEEGIDFLGYVIRPDYVRLRKRIKQKFARKMHEVKSRKRRRELIASFYGMTKHADCNKLFKKLTGKEMRSFKDLNVAYKPEDGKKRFPGVVVSIRELVNLPIVVKDFETGIKTEQGEDRCIVAIEVNGEAKKFFTNSEEMKNILAQVKEMPDGFPFETTIKTETFGKGRTKYVFT